MHQTPPFPVLVDEEPAVGAGIAVRPASRRPHEGGAKVLDVARRAAALVFGEPGQRHFTLRYWTGLEEAPRAGASAFTLVLTQPGSLRRMLLPPSELSMARAFVQGHVHVEGSVERATSLAPAIAARLASPRRLAGLVRLLLQLPGSHDDAGTRGRWRRRLTGRPHGPARDAAAIRHHYDVGNDFYRLWLDDRLVYSCAYFGDECEGIDTAQESKLEYICRKLRLRPGERLLDVGCGWGALIRHAARHHGVHALGITLSPSQLSLAREGIAAEGLDRHCRVELRDYRDLAGERPFDKVVSVGMVEHVGHRQLERYFHTLFGLTAPGGLFLNHGIVSLEDARPRGLAERVWRRFWRTGRFIDRYVFPDGELPTFTAMSAGAERAGYEVQDVESLRRHYVLTLRRWLARLEARATDAVALVGAATLRTWQLYLGASAHAFALGRIGLVQMLLARPDATGRAAVPLTRDDLYATGPSLAGG